MAGRLYWTIGKLNHLGLLVVHNVYYVKSRRTSNRASPVEHDPACRFSILPFVADGLQDFIELSRAVARAHARLFPDEPYKDLRTLQVIALALTELIPMFWRDARTGERHQLNEMELAAAQFTRAMMDLVSVPKRRFEAVLDSYAEMVTSPDVLTRRDASAVLGEEEKRLAEAIAATRQELAREAQG